MVKTSLCVYYLFVQELLFKNQKAVDCDNFNKKQTYLDVHFIVNLFT